MELRKDGNDVARSQDGSRACNFSLGIGVRVLTVWVIPVSAATKRWGFALFLKRRWGFHAVPAGCSPVECARPLQANLQVAALEPRGLNQSLAWLLTVDTALVTWKSHQQHNINHVTLEAKQRGISYLITATFNPIN